MNRLAFALLLLLPASLGAQVESARERVTRALRAYDDLDFDLAATLLRQTLTTPLDDSTRLQALTYLGAAEHYRGRTDSAVAVFRRLVELAPRYEPDNLTFPPEITQRYNDVRTRVLAERDTLPAPAAVAASPVSGTESAPGVAAVPERKNAALGAAALVSSIRTRSSGGLPSATGTVVGLSATARFRRFELGLRYVEGSLASRDLVEGAATLRFTTTPWLTLLAGPQIRRYATPFGAERWVAWRLGGRVDASIVPRVHGHAMLWRGVGLSVNVAPGSGASQGGEVGVSIAATGPFWIAVGYGVDQAWVRGSSRRETVQALTLSAGIRQRPGS